MIRINRLAGALVFSIASLLAAAPALANEPQSHVFESGGLTIRISGKDSPYSDRRAYQVVVSDELRTLSRLEVNRDGLVTDVWMTDLDRDGAFEIVVATGLLEGSRRGAVDIHEWQASGRFASTTAARLPPGERASYRGSDQFRIENGELWREFPRFTTPPGTAPAMPTGEMAKFRYEYPDNRWVRAES